MNFNSILDFFFPLQCVICGEPLKKSSLENKSNKSLCGRCLAILPSPYTLPASSSSSTTTAATLPDNHCSVCSRKLVSESKICSICRERQYLFKCNISLWDYKNKYIRKAIHEYKFRGKKHAAYFFAESIYNIYKEQFLNIPVIPAPCSRKRVEKYGWDHMMHISKILSKNYGINVFFLFKKRKTRQQKELDYEKRQTELRGRIYMLKKKASECLKYSECAILLDDVFTTGATAGYCSELLNNYGFKNIIILTIALD
ncbi:MAG: hypothetical protein RBT69_07135 [Spirochaetia bacterium]|jgi:competence protein ComFC|nr:hypothetical protein [Spirochaetia bacterium]